MNDQATLPPVPEVAYRTDSEYRDCVNCTTTQVLCYRDRADRLRMHPHERRFVLKPKKGGNMYGARSLSCEQLCELAEGPAVGCAEVVERRQAAEEEGSLLGPRMPGPDGRPEP